MAPVQPRWRGAKDFPIWFGWDRGIKLMFGNASSNYFIDDDVDVVVQWPKVRINGNLHRSSGNISN